MPVKIDLDFASARPLPPGYELLCAALRAAQAASPTASCSRRLHASGDGAPWVSPLFGAVAADADHPEWRRGSFHRSALEDRKR